MGLRRDGTDRAQPLPVTEPHSTRSSPHPREAVTHGSKVINEGKGDLYVTTRTKADQHLCERSKEGGHHKLIIFRSGGRVGLQSRTDWTECHVHDHVPPWPAR